MMRVRSFVRGLVLGFVMGMVLGILWAPLPGAELRRSWRSRLRWLWQAWLRVWAQEEARVRRQMKL